MVLLFDRGDGRTGWCYTVCVVFLSPLQAKHVTSLNCASLRLFLIMRRLKLIAHSLASPVLLSNALATFDPLGGPQV